MGEIQSFCSESQKLHYSDLLSLAEDFDEDVKFQRNLRQHSRRGGSSTTLTPPPSVSPSSTSQNNFNVISNFEPNKSNAENTAEKRSHSSSHNGSRKHQTKSISMDDAFQNKLPLLWTRRWQGRD